MDTVKEICEVIDRCLSSKIREPKLFELIIEVIKDRKQLPENFETMCYDIHEADSFSGETELVSIENNIQPPEWFFDELQRIKERNIEFWNSN